MKRRTAKLGIVYRVDSDNRYDMWKAYDLRYCIGDDAYAEKEIEWLLRE